MADLMSSALDDHLQRYGSSSSESNDETSGTSERLGESPDHKHAFVDEVASSSGELSVGHPVAECSLDRCASANNVRLSRIAGNSSTSGMSYNAA